MTAESPQQFRIPIGPQHPALKEPGHFEFIIEGETVVDATVRLGYAHRGIEKATEEQSWSRNLYLLERVCGICSHVHAMAYALAVEKLAGVEAPPRAQAIRVLVAEMERVHSHLLWLGVSAHEAGFDALFMYSWRDREVIMDALEAVTGSRVHYSANVLGGVKHDITPELTRQIHEAMDYLEERTHHYLNVVTSDAFYLQRTHNVGVMLKEHATHLGVLGPTARASGIARDVRVDAPYAAYTQHPVEMVLDDTGDLTARSIVRLKELLETYRLIREVVDTLPGGDLSTRMKRKLPEGEVIQRVEAPRGELLYFVKSSGGDGPSRVKVRTPTINNMASVLALSIGSQLADVPMILAGIDPCFSCNDRAVVVRSREQAPNVMRWKDLRAYGIAHYKKEAHR